MTEQFPQQSTPVPPDRITPDADQELRAQALKHLKAKRDLQAHIVAYITVNLMLVGIWWATGTPFFWPIFPILGWGIGLAFNIWEVVSPEPGPDQVRAEMERLRGRHA